MFLSIRFRLLFSYLLLLIASFGAIVLAFFVAAGNQPAPAQREYPRLAELAWGIRPTALNAEFDSGEFGPLDRDQEQLERYAASRDVRVMVIVRGDQRRLQPMQVDTYQSISGELAEIERWHIDSDYRLPGIDRLARVDNIAITPDDLVFGRFVDQHGEWVFAGYETPLLGMGQVRNVRLLRMVAYPRPTESLQTVLAGFGPTLVRPTLFALVIGLVIAVLLAYMTSRTIANPLQALAVAASAFALGDMDHKAPVRGPQEVREVAESFNKMSADVLATQQAQQDFMANVSHDLKTPLTSIQGYSQAIIDGTAKDPAKAAAIISDEAARLNRMVIDLTDLARIQAGQLPMHMTRLEISQIIRTVSQKLAVVARGKDVNLRLNVHPLPLLTADGDRLVQAFNNLIGNAIKYTPSGGNVYVTARENNDGIIFVVRDTGIGIPKKDLPRIFERFYQVDKARGPSRGTGLGLAITNEIVQAHHGEIDIQSVEGVGTTFSVWLPFEQPAARTTTTVELPRVGGSSGNGRL